jgi:hypothetical protein
VKRKSPPVSSYVWSSVVMSALALSTGIHLRFEMCIWIGLLLTVDWVFKLED